RLQDAERKVLAEKGKPLGKLLADVITMVQPETLLKWHRLLVAQKWDFSSRRQPKPGRTPVVWSSNSSVQFHAVILAWFSGSCAVKLSACHGKNVSVWLTRLVDRRVVLRKC